MLRGKESGWSPLALMFRKRTFLSRSELCKSVSNQPSCCIRSGNPFLAGWLAALPGGDGDIVVDETSAEHDALVAAVLAGAAVFEDRDDDGLLSDAERDRGALARLVPLVAGEDTDAP